MTWPQIIAHADMDAFYAAVEVLDRPELAGKPLIVGSTSRRGVVTTASYEARPYGVGSAMSMVEARRRCPHAIVVPPRFERYTEISASIMEAFREFSPIVEALSLDEAFIDMTGASEIFGEPADMGRAIKARVSDATGGLTVSVGLSVTKYVAKVASDYRKPDGLTVVAPGEVLEFLHPQSIRRLWGVGPKSEPRLLALGLRTIGDVAAADPRMLVKELGGLGGHVYELSHGRDPRRVISQRGAKSVGSERTLGEDVCGVDEIVPHLRRSADDVARRLRKSELRAGGVRVKLKTTRFELRTRQTRLSTPTDSADTLMETATALLPSFGVELDEPMRLVGIAAYDLEEQGRPTQQTLFDQTVRTRRKQLDTALDSVHEKFGRLSLRRASDLE